MSIRISGRRREIPNRRPLILVFLGPPASAALSYEGSDQGQ
jgi:hypothetical protein